MDALLRFLPAFAQVDMTRIFLGVIALALLVGFAYWFFYRPRKGAVEQPAVLPSPVYAEAPPTPEQPVPEVTQDPALTRGTATNINPTMMSESLQPSESAADVEPFVGGSSEAAPYGDHE